jgi:Raf kinase inhibitor-like YbhB/YbcL family protein
MRTLLVALPALLLLSNCGDSANSPKGELPMAITMKSPAFEVNGVIPKKHTGEGDDVSPALDWSGVPKAAKELALICDDPDAPRKEPWVHWVIYGIPPDTTALPENVKKDKQLTDPKNARQGMNDFGKTGYNGPMPPKGHGVHHYHFKLYAFDTALNLDAGLTKDAFLAASKKHLMAQGELIGTYERK